VSLPRENPRIPEGINASEENPLKEFAQLALGVALGLVVLAVALSLLARLLAPYVPFSWEQPFTPVVTAVLAQSPNEPGDVADATVALETLAQALLASSLTVPIGEHDAAAQVPADAFSFHLVRSDMPNAFATLGATIMVTDELPRKISSENGLAMVIAHEIAHVQLRHPIEATSRGVVIQVALIALLGQSANSLLGGAISTGGAITMLSFNRDMERVADERALQILQQHYGHLGGADEFFVSMDADEDTGQWLEFIQTHPNTDDRIAFIRAAIAAAGGAGELAPMPLALCVPDVQDD
jgi:predicted Zn-dependent protease